MFYEASSFNQDISSWDVSKASNLVSGLGPWDCRAAHHWYRLRRYAFGFLEHCRCCSWYLACLVQHGCCTPHAMVLLWLCSWETASWAETTQSLTQSFFSTSQSDQRHDDLEQYATTPTSTLSCPQVQMFFQATSFNQDISSWDVSSIVPFVSGLVP